MTTCSFLHVAVPPPQYRIGGILFKFVIDREVGGRPVYGSDRLAAKEAGHQLKSLAKLHQYNQSHASGIR